jgi:hypothetical protein
MHRSTYEELVWQLARLPGGLAAALPDFFGPLLAGPPQRSDEGESWHLRDGGRLELRGNRLEACLGGTVTPIATLPQALLEEAGRAGISALLLGLLALATGDVDGDRILKKCLPRVDGAARDLMLMSVCRLCG